MRCILARCAAGLLAAAAVPTVAAASFPAPQPSLGAVPMPAEGLDPIVTGSAPPAAPAVAAAAETGSAAEPDAHAPAEPGEAAPPKPATDAEPDAGPEHAAPAADAADAGAEHGGDGHGDHAPAPAGRPPMPFDIVRTLQFLQDQVARGNGRAIRVQALMLRRFAPVFADADAGAWEDARNRRAAILYALSGGPPAVLERLLERDRFDAATKPIAEGALSYLRNDFDAAEKRFASLDFDRMEPGLAAHINLVLGQMRQLKHPADAVGNLDRAGLFAPGGLIEEAALRLEVMLVEGLGQPEHADRLARRYLGRYARSAYAGNFLARYAIVFGERRHRDPQGALDELADIAKGLDPAEMRALLLAVSRRSLLVGELEISRLAGAAALKIDGTAGEDRQRAALYVAAAGLAMPGENAAGELGAIDRALLHPADVGLLDAAAGVVSRMDAPPPGAPDAPDPAAFAELPVFDRAQKLLDAVAGDLGDSSR